MSLTRRRARTIEQRFWAKVDRRAPDECWPWIGARSRDGRGHLWVEGATRKATHIAWELENGLPFPERLYACHRCDNPPCVNPAHIWAGTPTENVRDCLDKGRRGYSARRWCARGHATTPECWRESGIVSLRFRCLVCRNEDQRARRKKRRGQTEN